MPVDLHVNGDAIDASPSRSCTVSCDSSNNLSRHSSKSSPYFWTSSQLAKEVSFSSLRTREAMRRPPTWRDII